MAPTPRLRAKAGLGRLLEWIVLALMAGLALVVVVGVGFRKAGASLIWYDEVASILLAWLTYYGAALAALHRAHIGMPTLVDRLEGRARTGAVLLGEACTLAFFGVLGFAGVRVLSVLGGTTLVSLPSVPMSLAQSVIPIGAVLFIAAQLLSLPEALAPPPERTSPVAGGALAPDAQVSDPGSADAAAVEPDAGASETAGGEADEPGTGADP